MLKLNVERIDDRMRELDMNRSELAVAMNMYRQQLHEHLSNPKSCTLRTLGKLVQSLELTPNELLIWEVDE